MVSDEDTRAKDAEVREKLPSEIYALFAGVFPNTKYFDAKFDYLQVQIDELRRNQDVIRDDLKEFKKDVDYRFGVVDRRIGELKDDMNSRFEQVDKKFDIVIS